MIDFGIERILRLSAPKAVAMYEAVNELMEEGKEIYGMKISEITAKAGIGKGTAYEYFDTKEELLGKAVFYQLHQGLCHMTEKALKQGSFREQIFAILDDMEQNFPKRQVLIRYLCYYVLGSEAAKKCGGEKAGGFLREGRLKETADCLLGQARKEGLLQKEPDFLAIETLLTQFMGFCFYLGNRQAAEISMGQMKEFVYENIVKIFEGNAQA